MKAYLKLIAITALAIPMLSHASTSCSSLTLAPNGSCDFTAGYSEAKAQNGQPTGCSAYYNGNNMICTTKSSSSNTQHMKACHTGNNSCTTS